VERVTLVCAVPIASGNDPEIGFDAGTVFPVTSRAIRLVSEVVNIRLDSPSAGRPGSTRNATRTYVVRNLADTAQTFAMAFVSNPPISPESPGSWSELFGGAAFEVHQDGRALPVRFRPGRGREFQEEYGTAEVSFPTWTLTLGPGATSEVLMRYYASWSGGCDGTNCRHEFTCHARPAARWAGRIDRASFTLRLGDTAFVRRLEHRGAPWRVHVWPVEHHRTEDGLHWECRDWKPDSDLGLRVEYPASNDFIEPSWSPWASDSLAAMPEPSGDLDRQPVLESSTRCKDSRGGWGRPIAGWPAQSIRLRLQVTELGAVGRIRCPDLPVPDSMPGEAVSCVRRWRFTPAIRAGRPVPAWTDVRVEYPAMHY
jgi:hypothetical protein